MFRARWRSVRQKRVSGFGGRVSAAHHPALDFTLRGTLCSSLSGFPSGDLPDAQGKGKIQQNHSGDRTRASPFVASRPVAGRTIPAALRR